jgi:hypothetical protein
MVGNNVARTDVTNPLLMATISHGCVEHKNTNAQQGHCVVQHNAPVPAATASKATVVMRWGL